MKIQEYHEKRAKYDPIAWSKCNICKEKYPNDLSQLQFQPDPIDPITNALPLNSSEIPPNNVKLQASTNEEIPPTETYPNLNEHTEEGNQFILNDQTEIFEEIDRMNSKDTVKDKETM